MVTRVRILLAALLAAWAACNSPPPGPAAVEAIRAKARSSYAAKAYDDCAALYAQLVVPQGDPHGDGYNTACCLALAGHRDRALQQLALVGGRGFHDVAHLEEDADFVSLHGDPRWRPLVDRIRDNHARHLAARNGELLQLFQQDQADRRRPMGAIDWDELTRQDAARKARVREILASGGARVADDYYHAAMVLQHGEGAEDFRVAHDLAMKAVELEPGHGPARWLAAASLDRQLMALGKPQRYGTQVQKDEKGDWQLYPVDPSVTNEERARWGVPPLTGSK